MAEAVHKNHGSPLMVRYILHVSLCLMYRKKQINIINKYIYIYLYIYIYIYVCMSACVLIPDLYIYVY